MAVLVADPRLRGAVPHTGCAAVWFLLPGMDLSTTAQTQRPEKCWFKDACLVGCDCINYKPRIADILFPHLSE